tara:strand:+ start:391 stop:549 length:159 start_codon:yes stop_codon:yes gene_type:complete
MKEKIKERISYLEQQIAAGNRLDGWSLEGAKKELKKLKESIINIPFDRLNGV